MPRAVTLAKRIIEVAPGEFGVGCNQQTRSLAHLALPCCAQDPDPIVFYSIGTFLAPYERKSTEGQEFHITGIQKVVGGALAPILSLGDALLDGL